MNCIPAQEMRSPERIGASLCVENTHSLFNGLGIYLSADLWIRKEGAKLVLYHQPPRAIPGYRSEKFDLHPDPPFRIDGKRTGEVVHGFFTHCRRNDLAVGRAPNVHSTFEADLQSRK